MSGNFSDSLLTAQADHQIDLFRYEASERKEALKILKEMAVEVADSLQKADLGSMSVVTKTKLQDLQKDISSILKTYYDNENSRTKKELGDLGVVEYTWIASKLNKLIGVDLASSGYTDTFLRSLISREWIQGSPASEWWEQQANATLNRFMQQIRIGASLHETNDQIIKRVLGTKTKEEERVSLSGKFVNRPTYDGSGVLGTSYNQASSLVRTAVQSISNNAHFLFFKENSDLLSGYMHKSTLDLRTSLICIARSGLMWDTSKKPIAPNTKTFEIPPLHFNCRSFILPILKSYQQLSTEGKIVTALPNETQASMDGAVPATDTYGDLLNRRSKSEIIRVLGTWRYNLWKEGKLTLRHLTDQSDRILTKDEYAKVIAVH